MFFGGMMSFKYQLKIEHGDWLKTEAPGLGIEVDEKKLQSVRSTRRG
jgi:hypothetical protein